MLYADFRKKLGSYELDIHIENGDGALGLFGASGAGKSMALKCIDGIEKPDSGVITLNGRALFDSNKRIDLRPQERRVGYLFQDYALFPNMTAKGNILAALHKLKKADRLKEADRLMESFCISHLANARPATLSGGERQRVALARLFASSPELILLDEPFSSLDTVLKCEHIPLMKQAVSSYGKDCVMVSHDAAELCALCESVTTIKSGKNSEAISADEFAAEIRGSYLKIGALTHIGAPDGAINDR